MYGNIQWAAYIQYGWSIWVATGQPGFGLLSGTRKQNVKPVHDPQQQRHGATSTASGPESMASKPASANASHTYMHTSFAESLAPRRFFLAICFSALMASCKYRLVIAREGGGSMRQWETPTAVVIPAARESSQQWVYMYFHDLGGNFVSIYRLTAVATK